MFPKTFTVMLRFTFSVDKTYSNNSTQNRVATSHGNHGNRGKVMELFLVMEKVMEFQKLPNSHGKVMEVFYKDYILFFFIYKFVV